VSRSPIEAAAPNDAVASYRQGWSALSELIGQGRSFSGYERNCVFLNVNGKRFATASAATGLDLIDDSRTVASCDWDGDGYLDLWITTRSAPRVRFLRNQLGDQSEGRSLQLELRGNTSNRDAIGARVVLKLKDDSKPLIRTVRAGDGFLAQSSKRLHFGFDSQSKLERLTVRWPGGREEAFNVAKIGAKALLTQGGMIEAPAWSEMLPNKAVKASVLESDSATRTWIMGRVPMPGVGKNLKKPRLVNLWSSTCTACATELEEWTEAEQATRKAGLDIVALSVDHLSGEPANGSEEFLDKIKFPFTRGKATQAQVNAMEILHRTFVELQHPLPAPASFLLDSQGRVAAIYKGKVSVERLLADVALLNADLKTQRDSAVPYPGRWASNPFPPDPNRVAAAFEKAGQDVQAAAYLEQFLGGARDYFQGQFGTSDQQLATVTTAHVMLGDLLVKLKNPSKAARVYTNLQKLAPKDGPLHQSIGERLLTQNLPQAALPHLTLAGNQLPPSATLFFNTGLASLGSGKAAQAIGMFDKALKLQPNDAATCYQLAVANEVLGRTKEAIRHCRAALKARPKWPVAEAKLRALLKE
jgi:tetratricopeptide (TPR) repeat protein